KGEMGGDCLNAGCVPSKTLIASAAVAHAMRNAATYGVHPTEPRVEWTAIRKRIARTIEEIAPVDSQARYQAMGVRVIRAAARFVDRSTVEAGGFSVRARRFVIATGSSPAAPPIPGLDSIRYLTNETIFALDTLPQRLLVLGAGPIGLELAQAFRRLGSEVVVLEKDRALANEDIELAQVAIDALRREGVDLQEKVEIKRVEFHGDGVRIVLAGANMERFVDGSHLLVAAGRRPNVFNLGLEAAGVSFGAQGIATSAGLRTSNRRIYAVGDVAGRGQFTHLASQHAEIVLREILFRKRSAAQPPPRVTFTDPEIAWAGLSENEARKRHRDIRVLRRAFADNDRAQAEGAGEGHIKAITTRDGHVVGCGIVGRRAGELIGPWSLAISQRMRAQDIARAVAPYPTLSEISRRAAAGVYAGLPENPRVRGLVRFLRRFG
ncbi:MAG: FAD-dependent oxidoreductase, partial [Hyphomicrobiales bacterium]|nr:FAD-dependent oxidoreductase [Hyphomicrobiales bacterium]